MREYTICVSSHNPILNKVDGVKLKTDKPIQGLKALLPGYSVTRCGCHDWNVHLFYKNPNTFATATLYYSCKPVA